MWGMKKLFVFALILAAFALGVYVGHLPITDLIFSQSSSPTPSAESAPAKGGASSATPNESVTVSAAQLSAGQRELLAKLGIDADAIIITPQMIACAEAKVGAGRLAEIQAGATPSFTEGASLLTCYR